MPYELTQELSTLDENVNYVNPTAFRLVIDNLNYANAQFNVQTVALPEISVTATPLNSRQVNIYSTPDKITYGTLELSFLIDEKFINYMEIHDWLFTLVKGTSTTKDMQLIILDSNNNVAREIQFINAMPISLGSIPFDITASDVEYLTATVSFQYDYYKFKRNVV